MTHMLDTNICIYVMKRRPPEVLRRFQEALEAEGGLCISSITLAELEYGVYHSAAPEQNQWRLLQSLIPVTVLSFNSDAAMEYGRIRAHLQSQGTPIGSLDMLIAAHAKAEGLTLVTNNVREFIRVPGLRVENWVEG